MSITPKEIILLMKMEAMKMMTKCKTILHKKKMMEMIAIIQRKMKKKKKKNFMRKIIVIAMNLMSAQSVEITK